MSTITDQEFTELSPDKQAQYAAGVGRVFGEDMTKDEVAQVVDLHGKVSKLSLAERETFMSGLAWETRERDQRDREPAA
jgi:hypothetical protein